MLPADETPRLRFFQNSSLRLGRMMMSMQTALNTSTTVTALATGIRKFSAIGPVFPVYLEIEVGGKSKDQLLVEMKASGCDVSTWAQDIMSKSAWKPGKKQTAKFVRVKVRDLRFTRNPKTRDVWMRIRELGHSLCEPSDGPAIRLALKDQSRGDAFWTAMEQISVSNGSPSVLCVRRDDDGEQCLHTDWVYPDSGWSLDSEIVFRLGK